MNSHKTMNEEQTGNDIEPLDNDVIYDRHDKLEV